MFWHVLPERRRFVENLLLLLPAVLPALLERRGRDSLLRQDLPRTLGRRGPKEECLEPIPVDRSAFVPGEKAIDRAAQA